MKDKSPLTKVLAAIGTLLVWLPIAAPVVFSVLGLLANGRLHYDFLMPAELFAVALAGGLLLLWAALRARSRRRLIGWGLALMLGLLAGSQALAVVTGLASGETEPAGWPLFLIVALLAGYTLVLIALGVGGVLLMRDVLRPGQAGAHD